jgi:hypothetical protein
MKERALTNFTSKPGRKRKMTLTSSTLIKKMLIIKELVKFQNSKRTKPYSKVQASKKCPIKKQMNTRNDFSTWWKTWRKANKEKKPLEGNASLRTNKSTVPSMTETKPSMIS